MSLPIAPAAASDLAYLAVAFAIRALSGSPLRLTLLCAGVATTAAVIFLVTARARALLAMRLTPDP